MLKHLFSVLIDKLLPYQCALCADSTHNSFGLCQGCMAELPFIYRACTRCSLPITYSGLLCGKCLINPPVYDECHAIFAYQPPLNYLISACKFHHKLNYTRLLGLLMAKSLPTRLKVLPELLIPVPLHKRRLAERGYNQSLEIARPISKSLHIPIDYNCCSRIRSTIAQTGLTGKKRQQNIKNAFAITQKINAKHIAIIDDVVTTGSTVAELSKLMRAQGVQHIQVWCCARTISP